MVSTGRTDSSSRDYPTRLPERVLIFETGSLLCAVPADAVREVVPFRRPTRLPGAPAHVPGIMNLRGTVVTVIDLAVRLGLSGRPAADRCIVLLNRAVRPVGIVVDGVRDVTELDPDSVEQGEDGQSFSELAVGRIKLNSGHVMLLDMGRLVTEVLL